jgi:membrane fusion protein (multidrug efflux system)
MSDSFVSTEHQLAVDRVLKHALLLTITLCLAIGWVAWALFSRIAVYASTEQARIEVAQAVFFVQAPASGRVRKSDLELGREVEPGTVLVELEADPQKLRVEEEQTRRTALRSQLEDLRRQLTAEQATLTAELHASRFATDQARALQAEAEAAAQFAQEESKRRTTLYKQGLTSELEMLRAEAETKKKGAEVQSSQTAVSRAEREQLMKSGERQVRIETVKRDIGRIEGELAAAANMVQRLEHELGWQRIIASGRGRLGEIVNLKPGAYVRQGDRLAAIIPDGQLRVVAYFEPRTAIGRVRPGQTGRLRLDGFPWAEYGSVNATVTRVGNEVREGRVRVELNPRTNPRVALQHGLPGTLEIETERVSPATYLMRKAGGYLAQRNQSPVAPTSGSQTTAATK